MNRHCRRTSGFLAIVVLAATGAAAQTDERSNHAFRLRFDSAGIRSLKHPSDTYETDYIAPSGALGPLLLRYRTTRHGDWRELDRLVPRSSSAPNTIEYAMGSMPPSLASKASPSAERGVAGLRALNDGVVPTVTPPANAPAGAAAAVPLLTWTPGRNEPGSGGTGVAGRTRWVQYTFPTEEELTRIQLFWVTPPMSWRLLYQEGQQWKEVVASSPYSTSANAFAALDFAPVNTLALRLEIVMPPTGSVSLAEWRVGPDPRPKTATDLAVASQFALDGDALNWTITLTNRTAQPLEVGDLAIPLNFAERVVPQTDIYTRKLLRHALVAGHGSWVYWQRSNGLGPFLVMTTSGETKLEYFDSTSAGAGVYTPYVHAQAASAAAIAAGGTWRLPTTSLTLTAAGTPGSTRTYGFRFQWAADLAVVRDVLYNQRKFDTSIAPGMVVPSDLPALIALRTRNRIRSVAAEHPGSTIIEPLEPSRDLPDIYRYRVRFSRLGENLLTVTSDDGQWTTLEFFVSEPLETVIQKRAAFLVSHHQFTDAGNWYLGAYGDWDQRNERLRHPEDRDGLPTWVTDANDDAGNARPAFIASKNVYFPDQREIESLERYIGKYLWGGMQMTDTERFPYAIYGIPNWHANRASADAGRNGKAHVWRIYDYPHIVLLYFRMYQIARLYPQKVKHLDADAYLERAYRTAVAYWTVPMNVEKWSADAVGTMNEAFIPELIDALDAAGRREWAATLRRHWEGKVERFVNRPPNLYGSEFAFDSTGFESTGAFAKYATTHTINGVTAENARAFMDFQLRLNITDRGWLETTYYQLGSDYRGNMSYLLSYMSQLGGWSILDYALYFARDPSSYLRLGYASLLSSWALVNSGTAESGFGYWFPSRENDGAAGGGFMPEPLGRAWIGKQVPRGAWHYSAEQDVGYAGALRAHATIVTNDPVFGEIAYGGTLTRDGRAVAVVPRDGLRVRLHVVRANQRLHLELERDGFAKEQPVVVADDLSGLEFVLENRTGDAHATGVRLSGLPPGPYEVTVDGRTVSSDTVPATQRPLTFHLPISAGATACIAFVRTR